MTVIIEEDNSSVVVEQTTNDVNIEQTVNNIDIEQTDNSVEVTEEVSQIVVQSPGPQGVKGETALTFEVGDTTTLEPGSPATVENVGTDVDIVLDFGIPQGEKGDKGDKGDTGERGLQGEQGEQGIQGEQGLQGVKGDKGDKGDTGDTGQTGPQGPQGIQGEPGPIGSQGPQGEQGVKGDKGDTGAQGEQGPAGPQGEQGIQGPEGPEGPQGVQGEQGEPGPTIYPSAGIAKSTGTAWDTSITDNSANWNTAYGWGDHAGLYEPIDTCFKLDQTTPQDVVPIAGTAFSLTSYEVLPTIAPGQFIIPAIAFDNSNAIGFNQEVGAIRGGLFVYGSGGNNASLGLFNDIETGESAFFEYNTTDTRLDLSVNDVDTLHYFDNATDGVDYYPVLGGTSSAGGAGLFFDTSIALWDSGNTGAVNFYATNQDFSSVSAIFQWIAATETFNYIGAGGIAITPDGTGGTTAQPLTLRYKVLGDGSDNDGIRLAFEHRSDEGFLGTAYTAGYIDCIQTDASATTMDSYLSMGGYTNGASAEWLRLTGTLGTLNTDLKVVTGTNTNIETDEITIDLSGLVEGLAISAPILKPTAYSTLPEVLPFHYALGVYDRFAVFAQGAFDNPEVLFAYNDFSSSASIGADLTNGYLWANWDWCPDEPDTYSIGADDLRWLNGWFSGTVTADKFEATTSIKIGNTTMTEQNLIDLLALLS